MEMNRHLRLLGVVVLVSLVFVSMAVAQPKARAVMVAQPPGGGGRTLLLEVTMLMRLAALELTVDQLDAILEAVAEKPAETESQAMQDVRALRERLLRGEQVTVADWQLIQQAYKDMRGPDAKKAGDQQAVQLVRALLTPEQLSMLAQGGMGLRQQKNDGARGPVIVLSVLTRIIKQEDEDKRQEGADKLLKAIVEAAPEKPDEGMVEDLEGFLTRVIEMDQVEFTEGQKELLAELGVLLPANLDLGKLYMALDPARVNQMIQQLLMGERARSLLKEMRDARANVQ